MFSWDESMQNTAYFVISQVIELKVLLNGTVANVAATP